MIPEPSSPSLGVEYWRGLESLTAPDLEEFGFIAITTAEVRIGKYRDLLAAGTASSVHGRAFNHPELTRLALNSFH